MPDFRIPLAGLTEEQQLNNLQTARKYARPGVYAPAGDAAAAGKAGPLGDLDLNDPQVKMLLAAEPAAPAPAPPGQDFRIPVRPPQNFPVRAPAGTQAPAGTPATLATFFPDPAKLAANLNAFHQSYAPSYDRAEPETPAVMETGGGWWRDNEREKAEYGKARAASAKALLDYLSGNTQAASGAADASYKGGMLGVEQQKETRLDRELGLKTDPEQLYRGAIQQFGSAMVGANGGRPLSSAEAEELKGMVGNLFPRTTAAHANLPPGATPPPAAPGAAAPGQPPPPPAAGDASMFGPLSHEFRYGDAYGTGAGPSRQYNVRKMYDAYASQVGDDAAEANFDRAVGGLKSFDPQAEQRLLESARSNGWERALYAPGAVVQGVLRDFWTPEGRGHLSSQMQMPASESLSPRAARRNNIIRRRLGGK